jgi:hypothetical protein
VTRFADHPWRGPGHYVSNQRLSRKTDAPNLLFAPWKMRPSQRSAFLAVTYCLDLPLGTLERSLPLCCSLLTWWLRLALNVTLRRTRGDSQTPFCFIWSLLHHRKSNAHLYRVITDVHQKPSCGISASPGLATDECSHYSLPLGIESNHKGSSIHPLGSLTDPIRHTNRLCIRHK